MAIQSRYSVRAVFPKRRSNSEGLYRDYEVASSVSMGSLVGLYYCERPLLAVEGLQALSTDSSPPEADFYNVEETLKGS